MNFVSLFFRSTVICLLALFVALPARAKEGNLLLGKKSTEAAGVSNRGVITDGRRGVEGDDWNTTASAVIESERAYVDFDLGQNERIQAAYVQGDNNDEYIVSISSDGKTFRELWVAPPNSQPGLRERFVDNLSGEGRWIRLSARGGDRAYSVTELQLFNQRPSVFPPFLQRVAGQSQAARIRSQFLYLVLGFVVLLFGTRSTSSRGLVLLLSLFPIVAGFLVYQAIDDGWPLAPREVSFARATAAAIALLALIRGSLFFKRFPVHRPSAVGAISVSAILAFACFYNLGRPQFWDHGHQKPEFVHTYDMRVYQPFAKYFDELRYDGVYLASVLAHAEDQPGSSLDALARTEVRSLRTHRVNHVSELTQDINQIRKRFSNERWAAFKRDMTFFREVMGPEYLSTLTDHGANATPVWVAFARVFIGHVQATESSLSLAGLVDGALLVLMGLAIWKSFGLLPTLAAVVIFGANDLYMFGTNWSGATLRHDWLVYLGFAACALKLKKWTAAGIFLALSTMIRAFPVTALIGVAIPATAMFVERWIRESKPPSLKLLLSENAGAVRTLLAAAITGVVLFVVTGALYSFGAWAQWWEKVTLLNRDVGVNEVSLRALVAGADNTAAQVMNARRIIFGAAELFCFALVVITARKRPLHEAMLLALPLVVVIFHPSNYYSHFIFLLALIGVRRSAAASEEERDMPRAPSLLAAAGPLLAMCVADYWAALDPDIERHFQELTVLLFAALGWFYFNVIRTDRNIKRALSG